jgi:hypothetical protein
LSIGSWPGLSEKTGIQDSIVFFYVSIYVPTVVKRKCQDAQMKAIGGDDVVFRWDFTPFYPINHSLFSFKQNRLHPYIGYSIGYSFGKNKK